jgi:plastocyanin
MALRLALVCALLSVTALAGCSGSKAAANEVAIQDFQFAPASITVKAGEHVTFQNHGNAVHTATADDGYFDSDTIASGTGYTVHFAEAGTHAFHCKIHPSMKGTVTVTA